MKIPFLQVTWFGMVLVLSALSSEPLVLSQTPTPNNSAPGVTSASIDPMDKTPWWQMAVNYQVLRNRNQQFSVCLFGDSISSALGNTIGSGNVNFALGGMSTTSLLLQMQRLLAANVQCQHVVIAIGTNDAWYGIDDQQFTHQLSQSITLARNFGAVQITLIPAFYSTVAASKNLKLAGPLSRVDQLNALLQQVAKETDVTVAAAGIQQLFQDQALQEGLTYDGVHLNEAGKKIYRLVLMEIFAAASSLEPRASR